MYLFMIFTSCRFCPVIALLLSVKNNPIRRANRSQIPTSILKRAIKNKAVNGGATWT